MEGNKKENFNEKSTAEYTKNMRDTLLRYMEIEDLTVTELAEKAEIPLSTLKKFLYSDQNDCKLSNAIRLAKILRYS